MKKAYKKKLPKYWLGTKIPTSLGYQPNLGIGNALFSSLAGESLEPEVKAAKANILPSALNTASLNLSFLYPSLTSTASTAANSVARATAHRLGQTAAQVLPDALPTIGKTAATSATLSAASGATSAAGSAGLAAGSSVAGAAGDALGVIGALYGIGKATSDWIHLGEHRSAGDMVNTLTTNTYTTDQGNSYKELAGFNAGAERKYQSALHTGKVVNNLINGIGTGASIGSIFPGYGTAIGAAAGLLYGLGSWAFGFGDNSDEVEQEIKDTQDYMAMYNRLQKSVADSADIKALFYNRGDGSVHAANGKLPNYSNGKPNAYVSHGETNVHKDGTYEVYPGKPDKKDSLLRHVAGSDTIFSNNDIVTGESASHYFLRTQDYAGALIRDEINRQFIKDNNIKEGMLHAKCGKKPKYALGTLGEYALSTLPHLGLYFTSLAAYNRAKNADTAVPVWEGSNTAGASAINQLYSDMIDPRQYLNRSDRNYNIAAWNARRTPGLGLGGRAILLDSLYRGKLAQDAETLMKIDEANRTLRNAANQMKYNWGDKQFTTDYDNFWKRWASKQQANAAKENWLAQYEKNMTQGPINAAADALRVMLSNRANDIQNRLIALYDNLQNLDWYKARHQFPNLTPGVTTPAEMLEEINKYRSNQSSYYDGWDLA